MDRRSWLWRRKSLERSPTGETESSASFSSHSERFSDDQTLNQTNYNIQSPEVTSNVSQDDARNLSEKLSEALVNISAKEDLVKQHAKVAEEAVTGWERADKEVEILKKQNSELIQKNLILEEHIDHLDGALKECLRQYRQEDEEKVHEWESTKSQLEKQLSQLQNALDAAEKDKSALKHQLEIRSRETHFSICAAESASKQHLDAIKKVAKLEAECLQLKVQARRAANDTSSSVCIESFTDSHSDNGERLQAVQDDICKMSVSQSMRRPSVDIYLMDDFLEMERLASRESIQNEMEALMRRIAELEGTLEKITAEKVRLEIESEIQLKASEDRVKDMEVKLLDLKIQLALANEATIDARREVERTKVEHGNLITLFNETEKNLVKNQSQLKETNEAKCIVELQLEDANIKKVESEAQLKLMETSVKMLERRVEEEKNVSREAVVKCDILEAEISKFKSNAQFQRSTEFRINQDKEVAIAAAKFAECQKTIASLGRQLKSLSTFDDFLLDPERQVPVL